MLKGDLVLLRPVQRADITHFLRWYNDAEVTQYAKLGDLPVTEMAIQKMIEDMGAANPPSRVMFVIEAITGDRSQPIGDVALARINLKDRAAMLGVTIGEKEFWSRGYGTEACRLIIRWGFEQMNLHRISSGAFSFNERSIRLHLKLGFREEGRRRDFVFKNGAYADDVMFGILREDWEKQPKS